MDITKRIERLRKAGARLDRAHLSAIRAEDEWLKAWERVPESDQKTFCDEVGMEWPITIGDFHP